MCYSQKLKETQLIGTQTTVEYLRAMTSFKKKVCHAESRVVESIRRCVGTDYVIHENMARRSACMPTVLIGNSSVARFSAHKNALAHLLILLLQ